MNISTMIFTYNSGGGHQVLSFIGDCLLHTASRSFGSAIETVEIYARVTTNRPIEANAVEMADSFHESLKTLPLVWFKRKLRRIEIACQSHLGDGKELVESWNDKSVSLPFFHDACRETVAALSLIQKCLKKTDDFDYPAFESFLHRRLQELPTTVGEAEALLDEVRKLDAQRRTEAAARNAAAEKDKPLPKGGPKKVCLAPDDGAARYVGWTKDKRQFFLTTPFVPAIANSADAGREFLALYLFDKAGVLLSATIDDLGARQDLDDEARCARRDELLASLGDIEYRTIKVAPFKIQRHGIAFGFIPQPPEDEDEDWSVIVEPGDYMCFWPPWNSGDYDT